MDTNAISRSLTITAVLIVLGGCTSTARSEYGEAGRKASHAAEAAGRAIDADATAVEHKISDKVSASSNSNDQVSERVRHALLDAADIETSGLSVDTSGNKVTLHGRIKNEVENQQAEHLARDAAGKGFTVDDQLTVREG